MASKWSKYDEAIKQIVLSEESNSKAAKEVLDASGNKYSNRDIDLLRTYIKRFRKKLNEEYDGINEVSEEMDVDNSYMKHLWIKTKKASAFVKNPNYVDPDVVDIEKEVDFDAILKKYVDKVHKPLEIVKNNNEFIFDRLVYTDVHIGMDVGEKGVSLYDGSWDEEEISRRLDIMISWVIKKKQSNELMINDLGDFMDGYDGKTTRGGHELPQNMDNETAFDVGFSFKAKLLDKLSSVYEKITIINICNDNHSGSMGYMVNAAFKSYAESKYGDAVVVINQRKFIDHYSFHNRIFALTHGKDGKSLKFGFKPKLDPVQIERIKNYLDEYDLPRRNIEFSKGDSHQWLFDLTSSTAFHYQNFGAFSPPSDWVKVNYKNTKSMFTFMNYTKDQYSIHNYIFS